MFICFKNTGKAIMNNLFMQIFICDNNCDNLAINSDLFRAVQINEI